MRNALIQFVVSGTLSWLVTAAILPFLRKHVVDLPSSRSSHREPTPRGGGLAFVFVGTLLHLIYVSRMVKWVPIICLPLAITGFIDDYKPQPVLLRYFVQAVTAFSLVFISGFQFTSYTFMIAVVLVTAIINFTNFMDGLDGLVGSCGVMMLASTSAWSVSGAVFGFLFWNWSPARVFMGDVGSTFIGAVFCGMVLQSTSPDEALSRLFVSLPLLFDALQCLIRRILERRNVFKAHRQHLFQRLHQAGLSHSEVALFYILSTASLLIANVFNADSSLPFIASIILLVGLILDWKFAKPFGDTQ